MQQKTRRRRGSLRKVALLGRGAQRDKRDLSPLIVDRSHDLERMSSFQHAAVSDAAGPNLAELTPRSASDRQPTRMDEMGPAIPLSGKPQSVQSVPESEPSYTSTTDEEDILQISRTAGSSRPTLPLSSVSESYFGNLLGVQGRRAGFQQAKSPLSYSGLATTSLPTQDADWDYTETEWWGWVVLTVTWCVFVVGMGSCLDIWSWAWDVGKTPYAPPELEDDPTLPIVGYYPALIILTCVMAWVWVVVAWVGMKYFRHAKISGD